MNTINTEFAMELVTEAGPSISSRFDMTREPIFPGDRRDIGVIQRDAEDGHSIGRTKWYVAYSDGSETKIEELHDSGRTHDNCHTWSVGIIKGVLTVEVGWGGEDKILTKKLSELGLRE